MPAPEHSITLSPEQLDRASQSLSKLRHNVNNHLAQMVALAELIRRKPELAERYASSIMEQSEKVGKEIQDHNLMLNQMLGLRGQGGPVV